MTRSIVLSALFAAAAPALAQPSPPAAPSPPACAEDPLFRQLDFTLGSWDVSRDGQNTAQVHMVRTLNGCAIEEHWITLPGRSGNGTGLFTYSRIMKAWTYAWAADTGAATFFTGAPSGTTAMQFVTDRPLPNGGKRLRRWTLSLLPDGRIRELSVGSDDNGATWATEYDLYWTKKAA